MTETERKKELTRLVREQKKDMKSSRTIVQYKGRSKKLQPNYKPGDDEVLAVELENFILRNQDGDNLSE